MRKLVGISVCLSLIALLAGTAYANRGDYSSIVYISGAQVIAENAAGTIITTGTYGTNDTAVIQAALNTGGRVFLSKGGYTITVPLVINQNYTTFYGEGGSSLLNLANGANCNILEIPNKNYITLQDLKLCGNRETNALGNGVYISGASWLNRISRVDVLSCAENGILLGDGTDLIQTHLISDLASENNGGAGLKLVRAFYCHFNNLFLEGNGLVDGSAGLEITRSAVDTYEQIESFSVIGIRVQGSTHQFLSNLMLGGVTADCRGIDIADDCLRISVSDFHIGQANVTNTYGIYAGGAYCTFRNGNIIGGLPCGVQEGIYIPASGSASINKVNFVYCNRAIYAAVNSVHTIIDNTFNSCVTKIQGATPAGCSIYGNWNYTTESTGSGTGTGAQQTIAHGLVSIPRKISIVPTASGATVSGIWADATNIYVTVTANAGYIWSASAGK